MSGVFINYRRQDVRPQAGRLQDALEVRFGRSRVFRDVEAIAPGADFADVIRKAVDSSDVFLALIGPDWLDARDETGRRRLDDPDDYVTFEIATALERNTVVIPVLVETAVLPPAERLSPALQPLLSRQALRLTDEMWDEQVARLAEVIRAAGVKDAPRLPRRVTAAVAAVGLVAVTLFVRDLPPFADEAAWAAVPELAVPLEAAAAASHDGRLWVAGGVSAAEGRPKLRDVRVYDPGTQTWRDAAPLPVALSHASLVSSGRSLYVLGGLSDTGSVDTVYRLDSPTGDWQQDVPPLPEPRGAGAAAWDGGRLVFAGGVGPDSRAADQVWVLEDDQWRELGRLQEPREKLASITDGFGTVWFAAGRDPNSPTSALGLVDVVQARSVKPSGEVAPRQGAGGVWWPGRGACVLGGQTPDGFTPEVECFTDPAGEPPPPLSSARAGLGAASVGDVLYVLGGYSTGSHGSASVERLDMTPP